MRKNLPITDVEREFRPDQRIVSTTDTKGRITHVNDDFVDISGFTRDEIIGQAHNIVRHPDMPPAAFQNLWDSIKANKSWMGIVKNRCKNGDAYWVDAFVTPQFENGKLIGYQSVRLKPSEKDIQSAKKVYANLNQTKQNILKKITNLKLSLASKIISSHLLSLLAGSAVYAAIPASGLIPLVFSLLTTILIGVVLFKMIAKPWQRASKEASEIIDDAVAQEVYTGRTDELGKLQLVIRMQQSKLETVVWRINDVTNQLRRAVENSMSTVFETEQNLSNQNKEIEQVATAMDEMTATVNEIAKNTSHTATSTQHTDEQVIQGKNIVQSTIDNIHSLAAEVENAVSEINTLAEDSKQIGSIVDVITGIAEQTNLLALNAAIEAARAGEQGRGFAVVADEVRTLASRTQGSTHEIQDMVNRLQASAESAVQTMLRGQTRAAESVEKAQEAGNSLNAITDAVKNINSMTTQIATAAEEQSAVSEEINKNVINISTLSQKTLEDTQAICKESETVNSEAARLTAVVKQFGQNL